MAFNLENESYERTIVNGHMQHNLVRTYLGPVTSNLVVTCNDISLPADGSSVIIGGDKYWALTKRARYYNPKEGRSHAYVDVIYDNDAGRFGRTSSGEPTTDPTAIAPYVQVQFAEYVDEITTAKLVRIENQLGQVMPLPPYMVDAQTTPGPIRNSAGKVIADCQQRKHHKVVTYWTYHATWSAAWETYIDDINSTAFTVTQSDGSGVKLQYSFAAKEARLADIIKEDHWMGNRLYFRRGLVIETKQGWTWDREFPDKGHDMAIFMGQFNPSNPFANPKPPYTAAEIDNMLGAGASSNPMIMGWLTLVDVDKQPMTEPTPFNGWGAPASLKRDNANPALPNRYKLVYSVDDLSAWPAALGVS